ncbi:MAG TPA: NIPSNAP family protein [Gemmatimonadaceae bacterium]|nr:NIPSNAP family protein [Gemmatimonadaceae bacterium]
MTILDGDRAEMFSPIVELRQYTMHRGKRDVLINLFDSEFVEAQEALGIQVIGQFRNLDDPNKFVWLRGFPDMADRARSLSAFYDGATWQSRRTVANATLIDNDNVLLLRPVSAQSAFALGDVDRPRPTMSGDGYGMVLATIYHVDPTAEREAEFVEFFARTVVPLVTRAGAPVVASFVLERRANSYPRLPVRDGEHVFVWFSRFPSVDAYDQFTATLAETPAWHDSVELALSSKIREPQTLRLSPTARSLLQGCSK